MICRRWLDGLGDPQIDIVISETAWHNTFAWLAQIALVMLQQFQGAPRHGAPQGLTQEEWEAKLSLMVQTFTLLTQEGEGIVLTETDIQQVNKGLHEFAAHLRDLWD